MKRRQYCTDNTGQIVSCVEWDDAIGPVNSDVSFVKKTIIGTAVATPDSVVVVQLGYGEEFIISSEGAEIKSGEAPGPSPDKFLLPEPGSRIIELED